MSGQSLGSPAIRSRRVRVAVTTAFLLAAASLARSEWEFGHQVGDQTPGRADGPGIVLAPKVASQTTSDAVLISVTAPTGQPPGVLYTVSRISGTTVTPVCTGPAPLRCKDKMPPGGPTISYNVSSTLPGEGTATTTVDIPTTQPTRQTVASQPVRKQPVVDDGSDGGDDDPTTARPSTVTATGSPTPSGSPSPSPSPSGSASASPTGSPTGSPTRSQTGSPDPTPSSSATPPTDPGDGPSTPTTAAPAATVG